MKDNPFLFFCFPSIYVEWLFQMKDGIFFAIFISLQGKVNLTWFLVRSDIALTFVSCYGWGLFILLSLKLIQILLPFWRRVYYCSIPFISWGIHVLDYCYFFQQSSSFPSCDRHRWTGSRSTCRRGTFSKWLTPFSDMVIHQIELRSGCSIQI